MKTARAQAPGLRQETQYTCMATSMASALQAQGKEVTEADVNRVMGCGPMRGASWEDFLSTAQYFGMRATLVVPATVEMLRDWTSRGIPVVIAWNPEGRPWSHASVVVDVDDQDRVHIMDPNIPNPNKTFRVLELDDFYKKWVESLSDKMLVRRPACAIEREVTQQGEQVMGSAQKVADRSLDKTAAWKSYKNAPSVGGGVVEWNIRVKGNREYQYTEHLVRLTEDQKVWQKYSGIEAQKALAAFAKLVSSRHTPKLKDVPGYVPETRGPAPNPRRSPTYDDQYRMDEMMQQDFGGHRASDEEDSTMARKKKPSQPVQPKKDPNAPLRMPPRKQRSDPARDLAEGLVNIRPGPHLNKPQRGQGQKGQGKSQRHPKHRQDMRQASASRVANRFLNRGED